MSKEIHHQNNEQMPSIIFPVNFNEIIFSDKKDLIELSEKIFKEENIIKSLEKLTDIEVVPVSLDEDLFYISILAKEYLIA